MKNKLSFISIFTLCIALSLTACGRRMGKFSCTADIDTNSRCTCDRPYLHGRV